MDLNAIALLLNPSPFRNQVEEMVRDKGRA